LNPYFVIVGLDPTIQSAKKISAALYPWVKPEDDGNGYAGCYTVKVVFE